MALKRYSDAPLAEIAEIVHLFRRAPKHNRQPRSLRDRIELGAVPDAREEQPIDAGRFIGTRPLDRVTERGDGGSPGARENHKRGIAATINGGFHLADALR